VTIDLGAILGSFPRRVPVFPLPDAVLFPGAVMPLHVFEPRYRRMLADALATDRLLAIALLRPCHREEYETRPPFHETVCVGCVLHAERLPDGRSNLAILGVAAGEAREPGEDRPYPTAEVVLAGEVPAGPDLDARVEALFPRIFPGGAGMADLRARLAEILPEEALPAALVNSCAMNAPLLPYDKLPLLRERDPAARLDRLEALLAKEWRWN